MKTATAKRPRVSYKALFLAQRLRANELADRERVVELELRRLRQVLADHAVRETIPEVERVIAEHPSLGAVAMYPMSYEAVRAYMESGARFTVEEFGRLDNLTWKGRPLVCINEAVK